MWEKVTRSSEFLVFSFYLNVSRCFHCTYRIIQIISLHVDNAQCFMREVIIFCHLYTLGMRPWTALWMGSVHGPAPSLPVPPHPLPHLSIPQSGAASRPQEPLMKLHLRVSKLPQLSGHVESHSFALHEKLKSRPDRMEGNRCGNLGERSHRWSGRW